MNVYDLQFDIKAILSRVDEETGEISHELFDAINRLNVAIPERINAFYRVIRTAAACETAIRNETSYLQGRARRWATIKENMKEHLQTLLGILGVRNYETDLCRPTICKGPPVVKVKEGFNIRDLEGTAWDHLLDHEVTLSSDRVKKAKDLPPQIQVVEGKEYLRIL